MSRVAVVGGGIGGAVAARELARAGHEVVLIERGERLGGLVVSFSVGGTPLECFYHHTFPHEHHLLELVDALGLTDRMEWLESSVGVLCDGRLWPFTSPADLLRFRPLPPAARLRTGVGALVLGRRRDWRSLDTISARDWLGSATGSAAVSVVWDPLLTAKFGPAAAEVPAAWMWGRFQQRQGARTRGRGAETLGYLRGGFVQLFDALRDDLLARGVEVRTRAAVTAVLRDGDRVVGLGTPDGDIEVDAVVWTAAPPALAALLGEVADPRWSAVGALGVLCVVLELRHPLSSTYWTNVCDPALPFGGIIEHTNLLPAADYGGRHVVYLSRYFTADEPIARADPAEEATRWVEALRATFPDLAADDILAVHPFRAAYAAPLVELGHLARIPPVRSHLAGLYVSTTAQIYPQDRGMSEGVRTGTEVAALVSGDLLGLITDESRCPACGSAGLVEWLHPDPARTEAGVDPDGFRPSSQGFGSTVAPVLRCSSCQHGVVSVMPEAAAVDHAYLDAADPVSLSEEAGQVETGRRALAVVEEIVQPGRILDVGCWTGSLLVAAAERGWSPTGVEPSTWAGARATTRGVPVHQGTWSDFDETGWDVISFCDVFEHLEAPAEALRWAKARLAPGGAILLTVPDAGSRLARALGARWWSVLPMHLQYFTRGSLRALLASEGFVVRVERTHPKVFTARYYAGQLAAFLPAGGSLIERLASRADRLVAPDLHDRLLVVAMPL